MVPRMTSAPGGWDARDGRHSGEASVPSACIKQLAQGCPIDHSAAFASEDMGMTCERRFFLAGRGDVSQLAAVAIMRSLCTLLIVAMLAACGPSHEQQNEPDQVL